MHKLASDRRSECRTRESTGILKRMERNNLPPLRITLILKEVLSYLPLSFLLTCRLVARSWNAEAVYWIRRKQTQRIVVKRKDWPRFCNDFENCEVYPFVNLGLWLCCTADQYISFFKQHGHFIKDLSILDTCCGEGEYGNLNNILRILGYVVNLKKLFIIFNFTPQFMSAITDDPRLTQVEHLGIVTYKFLNQDEFLDRFFALVPNVRSLKFGEFSPNDVEGGLLLGALRKVDLRKVVIMATASFAEGMGMGICRAISSTQKLTDLEISLYSGQRNTRGTMKVIEAQENLFKSQAASLEELCIRNGLYNVKETNDGAAKLQLPLMKNLRRASLSLDEYCYKGVSNPVPFNIVPIKPEQVPNLHALTINTMFLNSGVLASSPFQSVQELVLENVGLIFDVLPVIAPSFPNLKKLRNLDTKLGIIEMEIIVTSWPQIEELEIDIRWDTGTDDDFNLVVGGVSSESNCWLEEATTKLARNRGQPFGCPFIYPSGPSLRHLTRLKKLRLNFYYKHEDPLHIQDPIHIDEIGVYLTFLQLSKQLCLSLEGHYSISNDLAALMTNHYQTLYFKPLPSYNQA